MATVKVGPDLVSLIEWAYRTRQSVLLVGGAGVGKSTIVKTAAKKLGIGCIVRDLSIMEAPDLAGMPIVSKDGKMTYAPPSFLPTSGCGILDLEELNRAPVHVISPCLQLLTERCLNDYMLPDGWICVATINPNEDGYHVNELDKALLSRFMVLKVEADVSQWLEWARGANVHHAVLAYVGATPRIFENEECNPRSWEYVSNFLNANEKDFSSENEGNVLAALSGLVGDTLALAFFRFINNDSSDELPSTEAIVSNYKSVRGKVLAWVKAGNTANLDSLCTKVSIFLQNPQSKNVFVDCKRKRINVESFLNDLPAELKTKVQKRCDWLRGK